MPINSFLLRVFFRENRVLPYKSYQTKEKDTCCNSTLVLDMWQENHKEKKIAQEARLSFLLNSYSLEEKKASEARPLSAASSDKHLR